MSALVLFKASLVMIIDCQESRIKILSSPLPALLYGRPDNVEECPLSLSLSLSHHSVVCFTRSVAYMSQTTRKFSQVTLQWDCYSNKQRVSIVYVCSGQQGRSGSLMVCVEWFWKICSSFYFYMQFLTLWSIKLTRLWPHITITRPSLHPSSKF